MELKGDLTEIIYQNEVNSYTIAVLETEDEVCDDKDCLVEFKEKAHHHHHH